MTTDLLREVLAELEEYSDEHDGRYAIRPETQAKIKRAIEKAEEPLVGGPEWLRELQGYLNIRREVAKLEEQCDGSCMDAENFHICYLCRDRRNFEYRLERLMATWGDVWAVQLFNIREHVLGLMKSVEEAKRA